MCYSIYMKKKKTIQNVKINQTGKKRQGRGTPLRAFFVTLGSVLGAGVILLAALKIVSRLQSEGEKEASIIAQGEEKKEEERFSLLWESIPEESRKEGEIGSEETRYGDVLADEEYMKVNRIIPWEGSSAWLGVGSVGWDASGA